MISHRLKPAYVIALLCLSVSQTLQATTFGDVDIGLVNNDNRTRTNYGADVKADTSLEIFADYGKFIEFGDNWSATGALTLKYDHFFEYDQLTSLGLGLSGSLKKKLGLGPYASAINASLSISNNDVDDDKRDHIATELSLYWSKRLNGEWDMSAGISLDDNSADNAVFDTSGTSYFVSADYTMNENLLLSLSYTLRSGDIITVTNPTANPVELTYNYLTLASGGNNIVDPVFGPNLRAYRVDADTSILRVALSYAINNDSSLNAGYEFQTSELAYGISYDNNIIRLNYIYSF